MNKQELINTVAQSQNFIPVMSFWGIIGLCIKKEKKEVYMANVFTGKVAIPGNKINEYFNAMKEAEEERAPFRKQLESLNIEFENYLASKFSKKTAKKHSNIIDMFIEFLCGYTDVEKIEEITKGIANTHFRKWYKKKICDSTTIEDLKIALGKFFQFLASEKGIENRKVIDGLKK